MSSSTRVVSVSVTEVPDHITDEQLIELIEELLRSASQITGVNLLGKPLSDGDV